MGWTDVSDTVCPTAQALAIFGDRWTMFVLRELFLGNRRFEAIQAQTGMSSHLLSMRLKRLEADGVIVRRRYAERPVRYEYRLTNKGRDFYPVLLALQAWGEKWSGLAPSDDPAVTVIHKACGQPTGLRLTCPSCGEPFGAHDADAVLGCAFAQERAERAAEFYGRRQQT